MDGVGIDPDQFRVRFTLYRRHAAANCSSDCDDVRVVLPSDRRFSDSVARLRRRPQQLCLSVISLLFALTAVSAAQSLIWREPEAMAVISLVRFRAQYIRAPPRVCRPAVPAGRRGQRASTTRTRRWSKSPRSSGVWRGARRDLRLITMIKRPPHMLSLHPIPSYALTIPVPLAGPGGWCST